MPHLELLLQMWYFVLRMQTYLTFIPDISDYFWSRFRNAHQTRRRVRIGITILDSDRQWRANV
jgi:hypothetical protein